MIHEINKRWDFGSDPHEFSLTATMAGSFNSYNIWHIPILHNIQAYRVLLGTELTAYAFAP